MLCHIYRSSRKLDTYLYLIDKDDFSVIPQELMRVFGPPEFSFSFDLTEERKLAREDASEVIENLESQGYHLQLQKDELIEEMLARKAVN
ncbi:MAG: YcgL domain-containing protein [Gammaproteobacteria bacterium]|nr:YcgL domain-containing protein [Gammaproteobacteria bacterium]MDH3536881.1 YcgL domain-containing protein [Gammaproteobacteria bacterium]